MQHPVRDLQITSSRNEVEPVRSEVSDNRVKSFVLRFRTDADVDFRYQRRRP